MARSRLVDLDRHAELLGDEARKLGHAHLLFFRERKERRDGEERKREEEKEGEEKGKERKQEGEKKERRRREKENR